MLQGDSGINFVNRESTVKVLFGLHARWCFTHMHDNIHSFVKCSKTVRYLFLLFFYYLRSSNLLALAGRSPLGDQRPPSLLLLSKSLSYNLLVSSKLLLVSKNRVHLVCLTSTLALKGKRGNKTLDLGCLTTLGSLLSGELTSNYVVAYIILLGKVEKLADVVSPLGTKTTRNRVIGKSGKRVVSHLGDDKVENSNVLSYDAPTYRLTLTLSGTALTVALVSLLHEKTNTSIGKDTLTHGESLLVVSSRDTEDVPSVLLSDGGSINLLRHTLLVKVLKLYLIINFYDLLKASSGGCNIDLWEKTGRLEN